MPQALHFVAKSVPGYGLPDGRCLLCSGVSGRAVTMNPCSSGFFSPFHSQVNILSLKCTSSGASYVCKASSSSYRRNPDFSRQNRHGYSRGRNRQNEERESYENLEESDILSSKNGPFLSLSNSPKFQATSAPGPREKEIVELFRKVQAQLRERAAMKEEKKTEAMQGEAKDNETVDSLLKLLRKHSEQAKSSSSGGSNKDFVLDQPEQNGHYNRAKSTGSFDSNSSLKDDTQEPATSFTRPVSKFQRKSPVPRFKYQPIDSDADTINLEPHVNSISTRKKHQVETVSKSELELESVPESGLAHYTEPEPELEPNPEPELVQLLENESLGVDDAHDDHVETGDEQELIEDRDFSGWKLPDLRALAKSRGLKGYSKLKKSELVDLLGGMSA
ncbi:hypothetical protein FEM48_Zijuj09G0058100 [Ziziphus jujuba var. spinosa]|uniref:Rho termination factor-like N-terminal domain-containing protein n=1 Tax=Ziziphus jujuba var. spinosa TaxID=714518 RepID=A0A978UR86_ZIZJJ|nr:hypothetical protein FEM48_Zijuj09G0058100 [Ziziphus jujuba var. spinosa]